MPTPKNALKEFEDAVRKCEDFQVWGRNGRIATALALLPEAAETVQSQDQATALSGAFGRLLIRVQASEDAPLQEKSFTALGTLIEKVAQNVSPTAGFEMGVGYAQLKPTTAYNHVLVNKALSVTTGLLPNVLKGNPENHKTVLDLVIHLSQEVPTLLNGPMEILVENTIQEITASDQSKLAGLKASAKLARASGIICAVKSAAIKEGVYLTLGAAAASTAETYSESMYISADLLELGSKFDFFNPATRAILNHAIPMVVRRIHEKHGASAALFAADILAGKEPLRTGDPRLTVIPASLPLIMQAMTEAATPAEKTKVLGHVFGLAKHNPDLACPVLAEALNSFYASDGAEAVQFTTHTLASGQNLSPEVRTTLMDAQIRHPLAGLPMTGILKMAGREIGKRGLQETKRGLAFLYAKWYAPKAQP